MGVLHPQCHGLFDFRVGIGTGGEIAVRLLLLRHHGDIGVAHLPEGSGHRQQAGTIQRGVDNGNISIHRLAIEHRLTLHRLHEGGVNILLNELNVSTLHSCFKIFLPDIFEDIQLLDLCQDFCRRLGGDLAAVRAIDLVAIVLAGVVGSSNHHARRGFQMARCKGNHWHRHQLGPDMYLYSVGGKHPRCNLGKYIAFDSAVIANGDRRLGKMLFQIVRQALRGLCNGVNIHAIGARANDAPQASCAKGQIPIEGILDLACIHLDQLFRQIAIRSTQPALIFFCNLLFFFHIIIL